MMKRPVLYLYEYLIIQLKVPFDEIDNEGLNPIYVSIKSRLDEGKKTLGESTKRLIELGANFDLSDR